MLDGGEPEQKQKTATSDKGVSLVAERDVTLQFVCVHRLKIYHNAGSMDYRPGNTLSSIHSAWL